MVGDVRTHPRALGYVLNVKAAMALAMSHHLQMKTLALGQVIDALHDCVAHDIAPVEPSDPHSGRRRRQRLQPSREKQHDHDDQNDPDDSDTAVTETIAVSAKAATEATKQEDDEKDDEYKSKRHDLSPLSRDRVLHIFVLRR